MTATTAQILSLTQFNRLQIANIQSTVSIDASSTGWRSSITSFTALQQYIETQYKASNPATYGNFSSPNLSRALFYMQFVSGLGGYGDPTGGPGGVMSNSVVGNVDPSTVTVQTYLQSPAWMCTDFANVLAFVLNAAGYQTDVIAADGHIFDEVLIDGQWWTFDSQNGFAFQAPWDQVISTSTTPQLYIFTTAGTQAGQPIYRQLLAQATPFLLDWYENGFFPGGYRYQLIDWLNVMPYGQAFLNEMNLTGWTATTPVAIPDYTPDGLSDNDLANVATIYRFGLAHVDSGVSTQASASGWRSSITSLASLKAYIDAQFASSSPAATGNFASSNISRALYYMEWVSGLWAYSGPGGANGAIASGLQSGAASIPSLLSATSAGQLDFATMLSQLFGLAGISTGLLVTGQGDAVVEATIDGQAWTFDPTTGVAYQAPWSSVLAGGTPNVYAFTVEGMQFSRRSTSRHWSIFTTRRSRRPRTASICRRRKSGPPAASRRRPKPGTPTGRFTTSTITESPDRPSRITT